MDLQRLGSERFSSLVISGIAVHTGEKENDPVQEEALVFIYSIDCPSRKLVLSYRNSNTNIETPVEKSVPFSCPVTKH